MVPFLWDLVLGMLFMISTFISVFGLLVYRYRRDIGPLILMIAGIPGMISSVLAILSRSGAIDLPDWPIISLFILSSALIISAILLWRFRK